MDTESKILEVVLELKDQLGPKLGGVAKEADKLGKSLDRIGKAGQGMARVGRSMSMYVTAPIVAAGAAAIKFSNDFNRSMSTMQGLVGISAEQLGKWKPQILELGIEMGKLPTELADAMFFITSAGLRGEKALDALRASAAASTAGLGETKVIADAVTSAMNAYGQENLSASKATDILVAAVREGKLEASALAPVFGKVLPTASAMGVTFDQVAGMLAVFSRTGVDAAEGATQLNAVLMALQKPGKAAKDMLAGVGLEMSQLREMAKGEDGLLKVMRLLDETFADNDEALATIIPNVRAYRGVMNSLAQDAQTVDSILKGVRESEGSTMEALKAAMATDAFSWDQFKAQLQATAIIVGDELAPVFSKLLKENLIPLLQKFTELPPETQKSILAFAGLAAVIGPLLVGLGNVVTAVVSIARIVPGTIGAIKALGVAMGTVTGAVSILAAAAATIWTINVKFILDHWDTSRHALDEYFTMVRDGSWEAASDFERNQVAMRAAMQDTATDFVTDANEMQMVWNMLVDGLKAAWDGLKSFFAPMVTFFKTEVWDPMLADFADFRANIGASWESFKSWAAETWTSIKTTISEIWNSMWSSLGDAVSSMAKGVQDKVAGFVNAIRDKIQWLSDIVVGHSIWPEMWQQMLGIAEQYGSEIQAATDQVTQSVIETGEKALSVLADIQAGIDSLQGKTIIIDIIKRTTEVVGDAGIDVTQPWRKNDISPLFKQDQTWKDYLNKEVWGQRGYNDYFQDFGGGTPDAWSNPNSIVDTCWVNADGSKS